LHDELRGSLALRARQPVQPGTADRSQTISKLLIYF
jgi:hypothetical protein